MYNERTSQAIKEQGGRVRGRLGSLQWRAPRRRATLRCETRQRQLARRALLGQTPLTACVSGTCNYFYFGLDIAITSLGAFMSSASSSGGSEHMRRRRLA